MAVGRRSGRSLNSTFTCTAHAVTHSESVTFTLTLTLVVCSGSPAERVKFGVHPAPTVSYQYYFGPDWSSGLFSYRPIVRSDPQQEGGGMAPHPMELSDNKNINNNNITFFCMQYSKGT